MEDTRTERAEPCMAGHNESVSVPGHRILDDLAEIVAECELLLPTLAPVYTMSKRVRNIRRLAKELAEDIVRDHSRDSGVPETVKKNAIGTA